MNLSFFPDPFRQLCLSPLGTRLQVILIILRFTLFFSVCSIEDGKFSYLYFRGGLLIHSSGEVLFGFNVLECFADQIRYVHVVTV